MKYKKEVNAPLGIPVLSKGGLRIKRFAIISVLSLLPTFLCATNQNQEDDNLFIRYVGDFHVGYGSTSKVKGIDTYMGRVMLGTMHGVAIGGFGDICLGADAIMLTHYYSGEGMRFMANPYLSCRPTYSLHRDFYILGETAIGASIPIANMDGGKTEFSCKLGIGIKYKKMTLTGGLDQIGTGDGSSTFYVKFGINIGK